MFLVTSILCCKYYFGALQLDRCFCCYMTVTHRHFSSYAHVDEFFFALDHKLLMTLEVTSWVQVTFSCIWHSIKLCKSVDTNVTLATARFDTSILRTYRYTNNPPIFWGTQLKSLSVDKGRDRTSTCQYLESCFITLTDGDSVSQTQSVMETFSDHSRDISVTINKIRDFFLTISVRFFYL